MYTLVSLPPFVLNVNGPALTQSFLKRFHIKLFLIHLKRLSITVLLLNFSDNELTDISC